MAMAIQGMTVLALQSHICRTGRRISLILRHTALLAGERQQKQHGQMPETTEKELAGILPVAMAIEPKGQVADVKVNRQRHQGESPGGDVQHRTQGRQPNQAHAVAEGHALTKARMGDGHHSVPAA